MKNKDMIDKNNVRQVKLSPALHQLAKPQRTILDWLEKRNIMGCGMPNNSANITEPKTDPKTKPNV